MTDYRKVEKSRNKFEIAEVFHVGEIVLHLYRCTLLSIGVSEEA